MITHSIAIQSLFFVSFGTTLITLLLLRRQNIHLIRENDLLKRKLREAKRKVEQWKRGWGPEKQHILEALSDAFLLINPGGKIMFANKKAANLFQTKELEGVMLDHHVLNEALIREVKKAFYTQENYTAYFELPAEFSPKNLGHRGRTYWFIDCAPIISSEKYRRVIIRDITEQHQTEQVRKDFVANASHELRTPMTIILGYLETLKDDNIINENPQIALNFINIMFKHGIRIQRVIEDMLVISKLESNSNSILNKSLFQLTPCITDVFTRLETIAETQKAKLKMKFTPSDLSIYGDKFYWTQIFFNLVENALKQNTSHPGLCIEVGGIAHPDHINLWVIDNGIGIPSLHLPFIFKRFYRPDSLQNQGIKGTGLGLSIVKRAIRAHEGNISVTSEPGIQTKFNIILPLNFPEIKEKELT